MDSDVAISLKAHVCEGRRTALVLHAGEADAVVAQAQHPADGTHGLTKQNEVHHHQSLFKQKPAGGSTFIIAGDAKTSRRIIYVYSYRVCGLAA